MSSGKNFQGPAGKSADECNGDMGAESMLSIFPVSASIWSHGRF